MQLRLASFNVENLFARARVLNGATWSEGQPQLAAYERFNRTAQRPVYDAADKQSMIEDLLVLKVLTRSGAKIVKQPNPTVALALLRENRGDFLVEHRATGVEIVAAGRDSWIGWLDLVTEEVNETATRMTAKVIAELDAQILAVVEAENRPSLVQFNATLLEDRYRHIMLVDGNDPRGIDVGLLTTTGFPIATVASHVDDRDTTNPKPANRDNRLFSRDAPVYRVETGSEPVWVVVNHLKSQSRTGGEPPDDRRRRQANRLAAIYTELRATGANLVAVVGDFNRGVDNDGGHPSLEALFDPALQLVDTYTLPVFDIGPRPGTFQSCSLRDRLDYIFVSPALAATVTAGGIFRTGLWGRATNINPAADWTIYPEITASKEAASDHAAIWIDIQT